MRRTVPPAVGGVARNLATMPKEPAALPPFVARRSPSTPCEQEFVASSSRACGYGLVNKPPGAGAGRRTAGEGGGRLPASAGSDPPASSQLERLVREPH